MLFRCPGRPLIGADGGLGISCPISSESFSEQAGADFHSYHQLSVKRVWVVGKGRGRSEGWVSLGALELRKKGGWGIEGDVSVMARDKRVWWSTYKARQHSSVQGSSAQADGCLALSGALPALEGMLPGPASALWRGRCGGDGRGPHNARCLVLPE